MNKSRYTVPVKTIKKGMELIEKNEGPNATVSVEHMLSTYFSTAARQLDENFNKQFTLGYIQGRKDERISE